MKRETSEREEIRCRVCQEETKARMLEAEAQTGMKDTEKEAITCVVSFKEKES